MNEEYQNPEMLRKLARETALLPREIDPPADAWDGIRAVIERERVQSVDRKRRKLRWLERPAFLAAAALVLVAGSSIVTAVVMNRRGDASGQLAATSPIAANSRTAPQALVEFTARENDYIETTNRLMAILDRNSNDLAPETISKLKESVRVIDAAILEARRALAADPSNKVLMDILADSYSQKVDLLKRTTEMGQT